MVTDQDVQRIAAAAADQVMARLFSPSPGPGQYLTVITQEVANGVDTSGRGLNSKLASIMTSLQQLLGR